MLKLFRTFFFITFFGFLNFGCGPAPSSDNSPISSECKSGTAQILVGDGYLSPLCGCTSPQEKGGTIFPAPSNLTCHLAQNNTTVFFLYSGTKLKHQIIAAGANQFPPSAINDPDSGNPIRIHVITLTQPATTFNFLDQFSGMRGQIFTP